MRHVYVLGATGSLGNSLSKTLSLNSNLRVTAISKSTIGKHDLRNLQNYFSMTKPVTLINCIGILPNKSEEHPDLSQEANVDIVASLVELVKQRTNIHLIQMSSSLVFGGEKETPYSEFDERLPINTYGRHKLEAENLILANIPEQSQILRFGSLITSDINDRTTFNSIMRKMIETRSIDLVAGRTISICTVQMLIQHLIEPNHSFPVCHLSHSEPTSWEEIVNYVLTELRMSEYITVNSISSRTEGLVSDLAPRPQNSSLTSLVDTSCSSQDWKYSISQQLPLLELNFQRKL